MQEGRKERQDMGAEKDSLCVTPHINGTKTPRSGQFTMTQKWHMPGYAKDTEEVFAARLGRIDAAGKEALPSPAAELLVTEDPAYREEEYTLDIGESGVRVTVSGKQGYCRALETLFQLLAFGNGRTDCMVIHDMPRFGKRSFMLDCCRHFFRTDEIKKIIEQASLAHMNMFHWHLSDDQGYRIESRKFPALNRISSWRRLAVMDPVVTEYGAAPGDRYGGYYRFDEIRDVVSFAAARGVDVVPEIDLPGHSSAVLSAFPQYTCKGTPLSVQNTFGVHKRIFCAGKEETFSFLEDLIDEIAALFPSPWFHIGGDEAPKDEWKKCPHCRARMAALGFESYEQLQCYFTGRLAAHLREIGKIPICWNESVISDGLAPEAVVQYWAEMGAGDSYCVREAQKGRKFLLSNCDQFYCTDSYAAMSLGCTQQYEPNLKGQPIPDENVFGIEMPMWTKWSPTGAEIEPQMYPRLLAAAECGWTSKKDAQDLLSRVHTWLGTPALSLMTAWPWEKITVHGEEALREIAAGLVAMGSRYHRMAEAEAAAGGEAGTVAAVTPDDEKPQAPVDPRDMIRAYVAGKMSYGFTGEDIGKVADMVLGMTAR